MVLRILVIDDDRERLGALEFGLKVLGYLVTAELCGDRMIEKIKMRVGGLSVDLLIAPMVMQGKSIYPILEQLGKQGFYMPVIAICGENSANSFTEPQSDYRGVVNFIKEPFTLNRLARLINTFLN